MKSKVVLFTSIFITVFFLLAAVGVASAMQSNSAATVQDTNANGTTGTVTQPTDLPQGFAEREAAYQNLIAQANQRIETLNNEVATLQQQKSPSSVQPAITADKAAQIAVDAAGGDEALQKMPELVNYQGSEAFEVNLENGVVYVDAQSGKVIFNGVPQKITSQQAGEIAGQYLGGMDPKYADIRLVNMNGTQIYQVSFAGDKLYVIFIDQSGKILKAQIVNYTGGGGGGAPQVTSKGEPEHDSD
jgi:uncharacterized membrane protein YkoI